MKLPESLILLQCKTTDKLGGRLLCGGVGMEEKGKENIGSGTKGLLTGTPRLAELESGREGERRRLRDVFDEPFDALDAFLREIERRIQDEHYAFSLCGRPLLRGIHNRIKEVLAEIEKKTGNINVYLDENHPMYSPGYEPIVRIEIETSHTEDMRGDAAGEAGSRPMPEEGQRAVPGKVHDGVLDFRTVKADTPEEGELQRVFEIMKRGGEPWELLKGSIAYSSDSVGRSANERPSEAEGGEDGDGTRPCIEDSPQATDPDGRSCIPQVKSCGSGNFDDELGWTCSFSSV